MCDKGDAMAVSVLRGRKPRGRDGGKIKNKYTKAPFLDFTF